MIYAITGDLCSGKESIAYYLESKDFKIVNVTKHFAEEFNIDPSDKLRLLQEYHNRT